MRLVPNSPATTNNRQNHHTGLKAKTSAKTNKAPAKPPTAAVWVEIFQNRLMRAQTICTASAAMTMPAMKWGMCCWSMSQTQAK